MCWQESKCGCIGQVAKRVMSCQSGKIGNDCVTHHEVADHFRTHIFTSIKDNCNIKKRLEVIYFSFAGTLLHFFNKNRTIVSARVYNGNQSWCLLLLCQINWTRAARQIQKLSCRNKREKKNLLDDCHLLFNSIFQLFSQKSLLKIIPSCSVINMSWNTSAWHNWLRLNVGCVKGFFFSNVAPAFDPVLTLAIMLYTFLLLGAA